jgi:hypothetical protein
MMHGRLTMLMGRCLLLDGWYGSMHGWIDWSRSLHACMHYW